MKVHFYTFHSRIATRTFTAYPQLKPFPEFRLLRGDYEGIKFPITYRHEYGKRFDDLIGTGWVSFLVSRRFVDLLENHNVTGWKTFDVDIRDKAGNKVEGYFGFTVTGRSGPLDFSKSEIIEKQHAPNAPISRYYTGLSFIGSDWDGSDFFLPPEYNGIFTTKKVRDLVKTNKINAYVEDLETCEYDEYVAKKLLEESEKFS